MLKILMLAASLTGGLLLAPTLSAQVFVSVQVAPPPLPVYAQPPCPAPGYLWTPGYWAWSADDGGYFWVPGTWVLPPQPSYLWTPGYWAWNGSFFVWRTGYWGPTVGFYGGIDYGHGYFGSGYDGGYWRDRRFYYNRAVSNINVTVIHNTYRRVVGHRTVNRISYNGGRGGRNVRPRHDEVRGPRFEATRDQRQQHELARRQRAQFDRYNHGRPGVTATVWPGTLQQYRPNQGVPRPVHPETPPARHLPPRQTPRQAARPHPVPQRPAQPSRQRQFRPQDRIAPRSVHPQPQSHRQPGAEAPAHRAQPRTAPVRREAPQRQPQGHAAPARGHRDRHEHEH